MKSIIKGKLYNTDTAKCVGEHSNNLSHRDFKHFDEELYLKRTGEFFLHGEGGPMTRYAVSCGDMYCGGEKIIPLTIDEAKEWAEKYMTADEYIDVFGEVAE